MLTRRWVRRLSIAVVLYAIAPGLALLAWPGPGSVTATPSLPAEFAAYSMFTADAQVRPAGRAIALYDTGSFELSNEGVHQTIAVGADGDTYRHADGGTVDRFEWRPQLLSPDGTHVLRQRAGGTVAEFELVDLRTGEVTPRHGIAWTPRSLEYNQRRERNALLAWSPDGRYVAYAIHVPVGGGSPEFHEYRNDLVILDLETDHATFVGYINAVWGAAFAPDSRRLALARRSGGLVISVDGTRLGTWADPTPAVAQPPVFLREGAGITPSPEPVGSRGLAWSPDGATLAVATHLLCGHQPDMTGGGPHMSATGFVDMATGQPLDPQPANPCLKPLGWRSPTVLVGEEIRPDGSYGLAEASLVDGTTTPISQFSTAIGCEVLGQCDVWRIQLATNLLPAAGIRDSLYPDRGPWVPIVHLGLISLLVAGIVWLLGPSGRELFRADDSLLQPPAPQPPPEKEPVATST